MFKEPSFFADSMVAGIAILFPVVMSRRPVFFHIRVQNTIFVILLFGVLFSGAFSGYLVLFLSASLILVLLPSTRSFLVKFAAIFISLSILTGALLGRLGVPLLSTLVKRLGDLGSVLFLSGGLSEVATSGSIGYRFMLYVFQLFAWTRSPFFGHGLGQYNTWSNANAAVYSGLADAAGLDFNRILGSQLGGWTPLLPSLGLVGFATFAAIWAFVVRDTFAFLQTATGRNRLLAMSALCLMVVELVSWLFTYSFINPLRWLLIGLAYGYVQTESGVLPSISE